MGNAVTVPLALVPLLSVTVTVVPRKRSGSSCVEPSIGLNTDMPNVNAPPAANLPGANVSVKLEPSALVVWVMSASATPFESPMLKRFGLALIPADRLRSY